MLRDALPCVATDVKRLRENSGARASGCAMKPTAGSSSSWLGRSPTDGDPGRREKYSRPGRLLALMRAICGDDAVSRRSAFMNTLWRYTTGCKKDEGNRRPSSRRIKIKGKKI